MANQIGPATFLRCAWHMQQPGARTYEVSHVRSNSIPGSAHAYNNEALNEGTEPGQEGTQIAPSAISRSCGTEARR